MVNAALTIERLRDVDSLETLKEEWNALLDKSQTKTVELTYEWQMTYWKYFHEDAELFVLIIREAGVVVALAPLKQTHTRFLGINVSRLELIAAAESNYQDLIIGKSNEDVLTCVFDYLLKPSEGWDVLRLEHIPETSPTTAFLRNRLDSDSLRGLTAVEKCMLLEVNHTTVESAEQRRKNRARRGLAPQVRKLERDLGKVSLRRSSTTDRFETDLSMFFDLHRKRWNSTETPSMFNQACYREFYLEATHQLTAKGQIELLTLVAGEVQLAQMLNFIFGKNIVGQLLAYDVDYLKYSPELVLLELYVTQLSANGAETMDFGSYNSYKERWTNRLKNRVDFQIYPKRPLADGLYTLALIHDALLASLRRSERLLGVAKYVRRQVRLSHRARQ